MTTGDRTEFPSASRVQDLNRQGIFPYSTYTTRASVLAGLLLATYILRFSWQELIRVFVKIAETGAITTSNFAPLFSILSRIIISSAAVTFIAALIAILLQSKFFFSFIRLSFDLGQVVPFSRLSPATFLSIIFRALLGVGLGMLLGLAFFWFGGRDAMLILTFGRDKFLIWLGSFFESVLVICLLWLAVTGVIAFFFAKLSFLYQHRMSRRELDNEL